MSTREEIQEEIFGIFIELFEIPPEKIRLESNLYTDLDLDSLDAIDLAATLSKRSGIRLVEEDMRAIRTIGDIVNLGVQKLIPN